MNQQACDIRSGQKPNVFGLAVASVPMHKNNFYTLFALNEALDKGTVFPELYMPFLAAGGAK